MGMEKLSRSATKRIQTRQERRNATNTVVRERNVAVLSRRGEEEEEVVHGDDE